MPTQLQIVEGYVYWLDEQGAKIPLRSAIVDLYGYTFTKYENLTLEDFLTTDQRGYYKGTLPAYRSIYPGYAWVNIHTKELADPAYTTKAEALKTNAASTKKSRELIDANSDPKQPYSYTYKLDKTTNPILAEIPFQANDGAFSVFDALFIGENYAKTIAGISSDDAVVQVNFDAQKSEYNRPTEILYIAKADNYNWDTILHEYGHHIANLTEIQGEDTGGEHSTFQNLITTRGKNIGTRKSWTEGLADYLGVAIPKVFEEQNSTSLPTGLSLLPTIAQNTSYDFVGGDFVDLETSASSMKPGYRGSGEGDELSIARILWDLADNGQDTFSTGLKDEVSLSHKGLFDSLILARDFNTSFFGLLGGLQRLDNLWDYFDSNISSRQERAKYGAIFEEYGVSPSPISEWLDSRQTQTPQQPQSTVNLQGAPKTFKWNVGNFFYDQTVNKITHNNEFKILVYNSQFQEVLTSPLLNDENEGNIWKLDRSTGGEWVGEWTPQAGTDQERLWNDIVSQPGKYYVVITGSDRESFSFPPTLAPNTGKYWSGAHSFTISNSPPVVANPIADQRIAVNQLFNFSLPTTTFKDADVDAGIDTLTYTANNLPNWLNFDGTTFIGTPTHRGQWNLEVTATDSYKASASDTFLLEVPNSPPTLLNPMGSQRGVVNKPFNFSIPSNTFKDIDVDAGVDTLTFSTNNLPDWLSLSGTTFSGVPTQPGGFTINVTATDSAGASISNTFLLTVDDEINPALQWNANSSLFTINGNASTLQITLNQRNTNFLNEMGMFQVDDEQGTIDGIVPDAPGYLEAALERSQVIFSALNHLPNGFTTTPSRTLTLNPDSHFRFYLVQNSTTDAVLKGQTSRDRVLIGSPSSLQVLNSNENEYSLAWEDGSGNQDFADLVVKTQLADQSIPLGTALQGNPESEVLDFRNLTGSQVKAEFTVNREAAFNNYVGFYRISDSQGSITDPITGITLTPGQAGYLQAAMQNRVVGIDLAVTNQGTAVMSGVFEGGSLFAPFMIVNGQLDQLLDTDFTNNPAVYFPFLGANSDGIDHIRLLGDNLFGFEDLPSGGDFDYNDMTVKMNLTLV